MTVEEKMDFHALVQNARTCRRFRGPLISVSVLEHIADCARLSPSARNAQQLRFALVCSEEKCCAMRGLVAFGGALKPEQKPTETQRPRGYIVILGPAELSPFGLMDVGIAAQSMFLAASEAGLGCCMIGAFKRKETALLLGVEESDVKLVLAFGEPDEERRLADRREDGSLTYYRDENDVHCVPKITLDEAIAMRI